MKNMVDFIFVSTSWNNNWNIGLIEIYLFTNKKIIGAAGGKAYGYYNRRDY
jgi:hypothetical protein